jgi:hypothetical protein
MRPLIANGLERLHRLLHDAPDVKDSRALRSFQISHHTRTTNVSNPLHTNLSICLWHLSHHTPNSSSTPGCKRWTSQAWRQHVRPPGCKLTLVTDVIGVHHFVNRVCTQHCWASYDAVAAQTSSSDLGEQAT